MTRWSRVNVRRSCVVTLLVGIGLACATTGSAAERPVYFATDVVPILTKLGCNGGGCHGKATGQNGFRLSLLGYEPSVDFDAIVREARGRRVSLSAPAQSLLLRKAIAAAPHGGGKRLDPDSLDYAMLQRWIEQGASPARPSDPTLERITIAPAEHVFDAPVRKVRLQVTGFFSDGTSRDVTSQAIFQSNEPDLAEVDEQGEIHVKDRSGLFAVMVRYGEPIAVFHGVVPVAKRAPTEPVGADTAEQRIIAAAEAPTASFVDRLLAKQWRRLGLAPSATVDDAEFLRRATLDICGTLPTPAEVEAFVANTSSDKRAVLIDRLLERPEYASYFAVKWADILRNRGGGYATSKQRPGTALFAGWIRDSLEQNMPYDRFAAAILTASGSQESNPPTVWYRTVRTTQDYVESVAQAFLGVRIQCAQCHHHPADRWSQDDYYGLAAVFGRVGRKGGFADAEVPTNETIYLLDEGRIMQPRSGRVMTPRPLGGPDFEVGRYDDPRRKLAEWLASPENPYFARTMANRMWGHFLGRGIIHPIDDARSTNPPSNPELLDALAADFIAHRFDVKHLIRTICTSTAYARSSIPNDANRSDVQSFARYYPRRMTAEVLLDAYSQVLEVPSKFANVAGEFPAGTRAIELPDEAVPSQFLDVFSRSQRTTACECERVDAPALGQTLALVSSKEIQTKLTAPGAYVERLALTDQADDAKVRELFLRVFARPPRNAEADAALKFLRGHADRKEAYRSLVWALLASNEFLFNH